MRLLAALLLALWPGLADAAGWLPLGQTTGYIGPGDAIVGANAWYGLRCYTAIKANSSQAINIRRASDNTTRDIGLTGACNLDVATATTFCNATTCYATELYDQSGNGLNALQGTNGAQPQLIFNCLGSLPCLQFVGSSSQYLSWTPTNVPQPFTVSWVAMRNGAFSAYGDAFGSNNATVSTGFYAGANQVFIYCSQGRSDGSDDDTGHPNLRRREQATRLSTVSAPDHSTFATHAIIRPAAIQNTGFLARLSTIHMTPSPRVGTRHRRRSLVKATTTPNSVKQK